MDPFFRGAVSLLSVRVEGYRGGKTTSWPVKVQGRARFVGEDPVMPFRKAHVSEELHADLLMGINETIFSFRLNAIT